MMQRNAEQQPGVRPSSEMPQGETHQGDDTEHMEGEAERQAAERTAAEIRRQPEEERRQLDRMWRGLAGIGLVVGVALGVLGLVLIGFGQALPAVLVLTLAAVLVAIAAGKLWSRRSGQERSAQE